MGLGVLWWVFGKDPLDIGPKVSPYAPWAVPAKFHGKPKPATGNKTASNQPATGAAAQATGTGQGLKVDPNLQAALNPGTPTTPEPMPEPLIGSIDALGNPLAVAPVVPEPTFNPNPTPSPTPTPNSTPPEPVSLPTPPAPTPEPNPAAKPIPSPADFTAAVLAASDALGKVNDSTGQPAEVRRQLFTDM
jgi:hypothetical protein